MAAAAGGARCGAAPGRRGGRGDKAMASAQERETEEDTKLRAERDRFVAFAFCGADLLLELDPAKRIVYAAGAAPDLLGLAPEALAGKNVAELVAEDDKGLFYRLLGAMERGSRLHPKRLRLSGPGGVSPPLALTGYRLPDLKGHFFLAFRLGGALEPAPEPVGRREPESGLFEPESFEAVAGKRLRSLAAQGQEARLTFLTIEDFAALQSKLDVQAKWEVVKAVSDHLRAHSAYGDSAARIDEERFGLLHELDVEPAAVEAGLAAILRDAVPGGPPPVVKAASLELDVANLSEQDAVRALAYTIAEYARNKDEPLTLKRLSDGLAVMVEATGRRIEEVHRLAQGGDFELAFQPIVNIMTSLPHHFEVFTRLNGAEFSPLRLIRFAEDVGVMTEFDLAVCRRALAFLETAEAKRRKAALSVNLSPRSVGDAAFAAGLFELLDSHAQAAKRIAVEITESAAIADLATAKQFIGRLRERGQKVCLGDFGSGAQALHHLQTLDVDRVKLDGRYLQDAFATANGPQVLASLARLCGDLGVMVIADRVQDKLTLGRLAQCNIEYAQGYVFGEPAADLAAFDNLPGTPAAGALRLRSRGAHWE